MRLVIDTEQLGSLFDEAGTKIEADVMRAVARELDGMGKLYLDSAENPKMAEHDREDERQTGERLRAAAREIRWAVRKVWRIPQR